MGDQFRGHLGQQPPLLHLTVDQILLHVGEAQRGHVGGDPLLTDGELRAGLDLLPNWALAQKAAANRQVIAVMGQRLERGVPVVPMYGPLGLAFLQRQAEIAEQLVQARTRQPPPTP
jgi:hypothetical protein